MLWNNYRRLIQRLFPPVMRRLAEDWARRGLVIVLSDFLSDLEEVVAGFALFAILSP
jgi:hypothetical protein